MMMVIRTKLSILKIMWHSLSKL
ncbi:hypothetical protein Golax_016937 [Gossypium laxum]|uniref:Uncharacterized protein n=1 Tax=Gossypium laxum TaxID=34288 RepID=A0A7J8YYV7_9ROSI|nr:hypothetical protein [Gossypium laxum]